MKHFFSFITLILLAVSVLSQTKQPAPAKSDLILKVNGEELSGKITEIADSTIKFIHDGESLIYTIKKIDIIKVTFASGRIEFFNKPSLPSETTNPGNPTPKLEDHHNKVAILPFGFIRDNQSAGQEMSVKAQNDAYTYLSKHSSGLTILDPRTTNATLMKAGVTLDNMMGYTMQELCSILDVEFVLEGTITQKTGAQTTSTSGSATSSTNNKNKNKVSGHSYSSSYQYYSTTVAINVYNDNNTSIYSQSHRAVINNTSQSYDSPLEYLLKRCPLYRK